MKRNSISFVIALIVAIAFVGSAQAIIQPLGGQINTSGALVNTATGQYITVYLDVNPNDNQTVRMTDNPASYHDSYQFQDIERMLLRNGFASGQTYNATVVMYCSGTQYDQNGDPIGTYVNTHRNTTPTTAHVMGVYDGNQDTPSILEVEPCPTETRPDLIVDSITPNCGGYLFGNESNTISAKIENIGNATAVASTACFVLSDGHSATASVGQLAPGANETVTITDPTIRSFNDTVTITVTADCYDANPTEWNESNNVTTKDVTVVNNGYKGKTYTGGSNITTVKSYDLNGNLVYSVGDSYYLSSYSYPDWTTYNVSWTAGDLPVSGTIKEARLYVTYTWDKKDVMPDNVSLKFNDVTQTVDEHYQDEKMYDTSYPYGMLVYNVTDDFNAAGNYANLTNAYTGGDNVSMRGMLLVAIYENASEPERLIYVNEEFDLLYGGSGKCTTPEEATAWAPITGSINTATIANATLITVAPGAGPNEGELIFNGHVWNDVWNYSGSSQIGIDERDVASYLESTDNLVGFQSSADWMEASNAFLVLEKRGEVVVSVDPCSATIGSDPSDRTTVNISLNGIADYGSGTIHLYYDPLVVEIDSIGPGDSDDFTANPVYPPSTPPYQGGGHVKISASNANGTSGDVAFVNVTFRPTGVSSDCTSLNLTVETLYDMNYAPLQTAVNNCSICIVESNKPIVSPPIATPAVILNDTPQMRARVQQIAAPYCTNVTNLTVFVTDDTEVSAVYVNLTPILGAGNEMVRMTGPDGSAAGTWYKETNASYSSLTPYSLNVMAVDCYGKWNNDSSFTLTVNRRGDVRSPTLTADNKVTGKDYFYIARYTVGLEPAPEDCTAQVQPANSWDGVDMADALYIAMYVVHGSSGYPAP